MCSVPTAGYGQNRLSIPSTVQKFTGALGTNGRVSAWLEQRKVVETTNAHLLPLHSGAHRHDSFPSQPPRHPKPAEKGRGTTNKDKSRQTSHKSSVGYKVSAQLNL